MSDPIMTPAADTPSAVSGRLEAVRRTVPDGVTLVAVSKFHPAADIAEAYRCGQRDFGESRAQELRDKAASLPADIRWHFIGHLQTNKVRPVVECAHTIQSIDSLRLMQAVCREALRQQRRGLRVLLQLHVAMEETKTGFTPAELEESIGALLDLAREAGVTVAGVMGMASNTDDQARVDADFRAIRAVFDRLRLGPCAGLDAFDTVSMGMSHDRATAIACGSTMVRVGTDIFGERI